MTTERFFNRHEFKYVITEETAAGVLESIQPHMKRDRHTNEEAHYRISSLYFDTRENLFHEEYLREEVFRQKLRLRVYNQPSLMDHCFFEIKKKFQGFVSKRRAQLTLASTYAWLEGRVTTDEICQAFPEEAHVIREIDFLRTHYKLEPRVVISYIRQAHVGIFDDTLRVTMDRQLTRRYTHLQPHMLPATDTGYLPDSRVVLEVKSSGTIPLWLARTLSGLSCRKQAFSKYSTSYNTPETNDTAVVTDRRHA